MAQQADDIEVIVPVVKSEPHDTTPTVQPTIQPMVEQTMAMYEDGAQQDTMVEQYDDHYGGGYDEQFVDQGYDTSMVGQGGQDAAGTGINHFIIILSTLMLFNISVFLNICYINLFIVVLNFPLSIFMINVGEISNPKYFLYIITMIFLMLMTIII